MDRVSDDLKRCHGCVNIISIKKESCYIKSIVDIRSVIRYVNSMSSFVLSVLGVRVHRM